MEEQGKDGFRVFHWQIKEVAAIGKFDQGQEQAGLKDRTKSLKMKIQEQALKKTGHQKQGPASQKDPRCLHDSALA